LFHDTPQYTSATLIVYNEYGIFNSNLSNTRILPSASNPTSLSRKEW